MDELTCISRVGGSVEEAGRTGDTQVSHAGTVAIHGGRDGVVAGLLWRGARNVASRRNTVGVTGVPYSRQQPSAQTTTTTIQHQFPQRDHACPEAPPPPMTFTVL